MTVGEFIEVLQQYDPGAELLFQCWDGMKDGPVCVQTATGPEGGQVVFSWPPTTPDRPPSRRRGEE